MVANRFHRPIQCGHGVIGQEKPDARIVICSPLVVQSAEPIQPCGCTLSSADADLHGKDFSRKQIMALEVFQQRPEIGYRVRNSFRMVSVRRACWQSLLEAMSCGCFPEWKVLPEQVVEAPDNARTYRCERFEIYALP